MVLNIPCSTWLLHLYLHVTMGLPHMQHEMRRCTGVDDHPGRSVGRSYLAMLHVESKIGSPRCLSSTVVAPNKVYRYQRGHRRARPYVLEHYTLQYCTPAFTDDSSEALHTSSSRHIDLNRPPAVTNYDARHARLDRLLDEAHRKSLWHVDARLGPRLHDFTLHPPDAVLHGAVRGESLSLRSCKIVSYIRVPL